MGHYTVIGLSLVREDREFQGRPLHEALAAKDVDARCGLLIVDLRSGAVVEMVRIEGRVRELFDIAVLPGTRCPSLIGMKGAEVRRVLSIDEQLDRARASCPQTCASMRAAGRYPDAPRCQATMVLSPKTSLRLGRQVPLERTGQIGPPIQASSE